MSKGRTDCGPDPAIPSTTIARLSVQGLPRCRAVELTAEVPGKNGLTGGTTISGILLRNVGTRACFIDGTPTVEPLDGSGRVIPHHLVMVDGDFSRAAATGLAPGHRNDPLGEAVIPMSFSGLSEQLGPCPEGADTPIASFRVALTPGVGSLLAEWTGEGEGNLGFCQGRMRIGGITPAD